MRLFAVESVRERERERERRGGYSFAEMPGTLQLSRLKNLSSELPGL